MPEINNLTEAVAHVCRQLAEREIAVERTEAVRQGNTRVFTSAGDVYHIKYTKKPFTPDRDKQGPARELHLKLQFAMERFSDRSGHLLSDVERRTVVGIDEDLLLGLVALQERERKASFIVTVLPGKQTLWLAAADFYEFVMSYDTLMKYPREGPPVAYVPTGHFFRWAEVVSALPVLAPVAG